MSIACNEYEEALARKVLECDEGALKAALDLLEYAQPPSLSAAAQLVEAHGSLTADGFDQLARAYDIYWHQQGTPCD